MHEPIYIGQSKTFISHFSLIVVYSKQQTKITVGSGCSSSPKMVPRTAAKSYDLHLTSSYTLIKPGPVGELRRCTMMQEGTIGRVMILVNRLLLRGLG